MNVFAWIWRVGGDLISELGVWAKWSSVIWVSYSAYFYISLWSGHQPLTLSVNNFELKVSDASASAMADMDEAVKPKKSR